MSIRRSIKRIRRLERMVVEYCKWNRINDPTNTDPIISNNSSASDPDVSYTEAVHYFIGTAIQTAHKGYSTANNVTEFVVENVINFLWWMKLHRWFFIIEKTYIILKLISDIIL